MDNENIEELKEKTYDSDSDNNINEETNISEETKEYEEEEIEVSDEVIDSSESVEEAEEEPISNEKNVDNKNNKKNNNVKKAIIITTAAITLIIVTVLVTLLITKDKGNNKNNNSNNNNISNETSNKLKELPKPEITGGQRGELGIDKNINESNIDDYLGREDAIYRDMRMLEDPANYEAIGGDRYLSGYIKGFEITPLPYILPVTNLPKQVGKTYEGKTLFSVDKNGNYVANYDESRKILEELFPKDKIIFLMCGGGGYAGMMRQALISLGWDENKIYNIGGYWYYEGKNKIEVKKVVDGKTVYAFEGVPYHKIEFSKLTPIKTSEDTKPKDTAISLTKKYYNNGLVTQIDKINYDGVEEWYSKEVEKLDINKLCPSSSNDNNESNNNSNNTENTEDSNKNENGNENENEDDTKECKAYEDEIAKLDTIYDKKMDEVSTKKAKLFNNLLDSNETFIITFDEGYKCGGSLENDPRGYMFDIAYKYNIYVYDIGMNVYKKTRLYETVKYAPGVIIYSNGKILAYTDAESDKQKKIYESTKEFKKWLTKYVKLTKN